MVRGPMYGLAYCMAGLALGIVAAVIGGWPSLPVWLIAVLLFAAGVWTAVFSGAWLWIIRRVTRSPRD